jgi:hypothetical protein
MKHLKKYLEVIKVPIKVGDTVLGGRFKNKKTLVKKIGKNAKGDITINGKPLLRYRIVKESISELEYEVNDYLADLLDKGFKIEHKKVSPYPNEGGTFDYSTRIWKPLWKDLDNGYSPTRSEVFKGSEIDEEVNRFISMISDRTELIYAIVEKNEVSGSRYFHREVFDINRINNGELSEIVSIDSFVIVLKK